MGEEEESPPCRQERLTVKDEDWHWIAAGSRGGGIVPGSLDISRMEVPAVFGLSQQIPAAGKWR